MDPFDIAAYRLHNQYLNQSKLSTLDEVAAWFGAVQAQEYEHAKWALALRLSGWNNAAVEQAFTEGRILRTHMLRPTWHFVTPGDIRWIQELTAPRVHAFNAYYYRQLELDENVLKRSTEVLIQELQGGRQCTRKELALALAQAGIAAANQRLAYIIMYAELNCVLCSGPRRGKQFTYMLLDERAAQARRLARDEALAELTRRYFTSHGPAAPRDFTWWSSLTMADVKAGLALARPYLVQEEIGGQAYWRSPAEPALPNPSPTAHLLPVYDEYGIAYKDHTGLIDPVHKEQVATAVFDSAVVIDGQVLGFWKRTIQKGAVIIEVAPFRPFSDAEIEAVAAAATRFGDFLNLPVDLH